jgi:4-amino-4-deoxychorismate lyase
VNSDTRGNSTLLVNGIPSAVVDVADRGFQYGDGIFSTLLVRGGVPLFLSRHLDRLERDCRRLLIPAPDRAALSHEARSLCRTRRDGVLKIQVTRGSGGRGYRLPEAATPSRVLSIHPLPDYPPDLGEKGVAVRWCRTRLGINPALAGIKHMNRLENILARAEWPLGEIREGLMLDAGGNVTEGTMTNLFLVESGRLITPELDLCGVAGVMRGLVMEAAASLGRIVEERRIGPDEVETADEVFLTNCVIGVWPVRQVETRDYPVGPLTREIEQWLEAKIRDEVSAVATR